MIYSSVVLEHFAHPQNIGTFDENDPQVGTATVKTAAGSDVIKLQIYVEQHIITEARFKVYGSVAAIACGSFASAWLKGKSIGEAETFSSAELVREFTLPATKIYCAILVEDAIKAVVQNYRLKCS